MPKSPKSYNLLKSWENILWHPSLHSPDNFFGESNSWKRSSLTIWRSTNFLFFLKNISWMRKLGCHKHRNSIHKFLWISGIQVFISHDHLFGKVIVGNALARQSEDRPTFYFFLKKSFGWENLDATLFHFLAK